ncbi:MAG: HEAT repeat domain-containing protein [Candidatus Omnitrophica bacterium]|nr:HEAT repeat domain-containing protein [Candidatus Omnitrophota bacterium]
MDDQLQDLKSRHRKLVFLFGEAVHQLYKSEDIRFIYSSGVGEKKEEIQKLVMLLDYLNERIMQIEPEETEVLAEEDEDQEDYFEEQEDAPQEEEKVPEDNLQEEANEVQEDGLNEEKDEDLEEDVVPEEGVVPEEQELLAENTILEDQEIVLEDTSAIESEVNRAVEEECSASSPFRDEKIKLDDTLTCLLDTAVFTSDADRRLFEKNIKQLSMGTQREREVAIGQMAHVTPKDVLHQVYEFAMKDKSSAVRMAVLKNVARMKEGSSEGFFDLGMNDPDPKVRTTAVKGLGSHVSEGNRKTLEGLLADSDERIRGLAVTYLGIYYGKEGLQKAMTTWQDPQAYVRVSLLEMLSIVKPEGALRIVKNLLSDKDQEVKKAAEKALEKLMPERKRNVYGKRK